MLPRLYGFRKAREASRIEDTREAGVEAAVASHREETLVAGVEAATVVEAPEFSLVACRGRGAK